MNNILELRGEFERKNRNYNGMGIGLPKNQYVSSKHIDSLVKNLLDVQEFWDFDVRIRGVLISAKYSRVISKSNRVRELLKEKGKSPNDSICGAKFTFEGINKHVFTYYISREALNNTINKLLLVRDILDKELGGIISDEKLEKLDYLYIKDEYGISKSSFKSVIVDSYYVEYFYIDKFVFGDWYDGIDDAVITFYKTSLSIQEIFEFVGIGYNGIREIDENTVILRPDQIEAIRREMPYIISMAITDISKIDIPKGQKIIEKNLFIPKPNNEPTIGVIDTFCSENTPMSDWVDVYNDEKKYEYVSIDDEDYLHGTMVSSIIVAGHELNPKLDDGCGFFKVRHFGVTTSRRVSSSYLMNRIEYIVNNNPDIKVWNLSLGSMLEVSKNFISPEAAMLDKIQIENDVVFIVAGTNDLDNGGNMRIGAPADSLNSIVVNSVNMNNEPASYTRSGPVLSFFNKPDICYYGGDLNEKLSVYTPKGVSEGMGTSLAAPWIARKIAFLIHVMGFSREIAKALIIDAAIGWNDYRDIHKKGYGVVPVRIEDIVKTQNDEIRFFLVGTCDAYEQYTYQLPVPTFENSQPFYARATMAHFVRGERLQGVDYTGTELDISFGRVQIKKDNKVSIKPINGNIQGKENVILYEESARQIFRKWDNVKVLRDKTNFSRKPISRKLLTENGFWGLSIKTNERQKHANDQNLHFGIILTLKEMNGRNCFDEFKRRCYAYGWIANEIDIENKVQTYINLEKEIELK